jgi:hypothetical protein
VAAGRGDALALPAGLQLQGAAGEWMGLVVLGIVGWWLYKVGSRKPA